MTRAYVIAWIGSDGVVDHIGVYSERWPTGDLSFVPAELYSVERPRYLEAKNIALDMLLKNHPELYKKYNMEKA